METIEDFREKLRTSAIAIKFTKKDGSIREMLCTLMDGVIPKVDNPRPPSDTYVTVWDLELEAWRTVIFDTLVDE